MVQIYATEAVAAAQVFDPSLPLWLRIPMTYTAAGPQRAVASPPVIRKIALCALSGRNFRPLMGFGMNREGGGIEATQLGLFRSPFSLSTRRPAAN